MNEWMIVRRFAHRIGAVQHPRLKTALNEWTTTHGDWLGLGETQDWSTALGALDRDEADAAPHVLAVVAILAEALSLDAVDAALLQLLVAVDRLPRVASLARLWSEQGRDLPALLGELAGASPVEADRVVRRSAALRLGLASFRVNRQGVIEVDIRWSLERLLDRAAAEHASVIDTLVGPHQPARLALDDFAHVGDAQFLIRLLSGAVKARAAGINVLIHGPPGTGKTELARTLAVAAGALASLIAGRPLAHLARAQGVRRLRAVQGRRLCADRCRDPWRGNTKGFALSFPKPQIDAPGWRAAPAGPR